MSERNDITQRSDQRDTIHDGVLMEITGNDLMFSRKVYVRDEDVKNMTRRNQSLDIGIDFGGVLSIHAPNDEKGGEHRRFDIDMPYALESLKQLKDSGHRLHLISFCGYRRAVQTTNALKNQCDGLFHSLFFVKNKKFKGDVCKALGCDIMIDDTLEVLKNVISVVPSITPLLFAGDPNYDDQRKGKFSNIEEITSWNDIFKLINSREFTKHYADDSVSLTSKIYSM